MSKTRRQAAIAKAAKLQERQVSKAQDKLINQIKRLIYGTQHPEEYNKFYVSLQILSLMPTIIDNAVADVETFMGGSCQDVEMMRRVRAIQRPLESLLAYCYQDMYERYAKHNDKEEARKATNECGDVSNAVQTILERLIIYARPGSQWRFDKLYETINGLITPEAEAEIRSRIADDCKAMLTENYKIDADKAQRGEYTPEEIAEAYVYQEVTNRMLNGHLSKVNINNLPIFAKH